MLKVIRISLFRMSVAQIWRQTYIPATQVSFPMRTVSTRSSIGSSVVKASGTKSGKLQALDDLYKAKDVQGFRKAMEELSQNQSYRKSADKVLDYFSSDFVGILRPPTASNLLNSLFAMGIDCGNRDQRKVVVELFQACIARSTDNLKTRGLNDLLYGLSQSNFKIAYIPKENIESLGLCLEAECENFGGKQLCNILLNLSRIGVQWNDLLNSTTTALSKTIVARSTVLTSREAGLTFGALGKLEFDFVAASERMKKCLVFLSQHVFLKCIEEKTNPFTPHNMCGTLVGLGQMGVKFSDFEAKEQQVVLKLIHKTLPDCNEVGVTNFVHSFGKLNVSWSDLSGPMQLRLQECILMNFDRMMDQNVANTLTGLSGMRVKYDDLTSEFQDVLMLALQRTVPKMSDQQVSNTVHSLGKLQTKWDNMEAYARKVLLAKITATFKTMMPQGWSTIIHGLSNMNVQYADLPETVKQQIEMTLERGLPTATEQNVSNIVHAFGKMGVKWSQLPKQSLQLPLRRAIMNTMTQMPEKGVATTLVGLSAMGVKFDDLPEDFKDKVDLCLLRKIPQFTKLAVASTIQSLGEMEWRPTEHLLYEVLRLTTFTMSSMAIQNLSHSLRGLAMMGLKWDHLPDEFINVAFPAILRAFSPEIIKKEDQQWFADTIHALGMLGAEWKVLPPTIRQAVGSAAIDVGPITDTAMTCTLSGLAMMGTDWHSVDAMLKRALVNDLSRRALFSDSNVGGIAVALWSLGKMRAHHSQLPMEFLLELVESRKSTLSLGDLHGILYGLENIEVSGIELPSYVFDSLLTMVQNQKEAADLKIIASCIRSLAVVLFDSPALSETQKSLVAKLVSQLKKKGTFMDQDDLGMLLGALKILSGFNVPGAAEKIAEFSSVAVSNNMSDAKQVESLGTVLEKSCSKEFNVKTSYHGVFENVLPVDCAVFKGSRLVAVVSSHPSSEVRRVDKMKELLYKQLHPNVVFIHCVVGDNETPLLRLKSVLESLK